MIWKEHDDRSPLPVDQKWTEICKKTFSLKSNSQMIYIASKTLPFNYLTYKDDNNIEESDSLRQASEKNV